jgi:predicted PurR-regulated permease PerM
MRRALVQNRLQIRRGAFRQLLVTMTEQTPYSRERLTFYALLALAALGVALSLLVAGPFIPGLTWALAFAVVGYPIHRWTVRHVVKRPGFAAGISVTVVLLVIVCPTAFIVWQIGREFSEGVTALGSQLDSDDWKRRIGQSPRVAAVYRWLADNVNLEEQLKQANDLVQQRAGRWLGDVVSGLVQLMIALFALFYFFRDRDHVLAAVRSLLPLSHYEADEFLERIRAMTHATVYGTVVVAAVQGALGGLMFWWLGIRGAFLWGVAMGLLAIVPVLGAFVIWLPAALLLAAQGDWGKALILAGWGTIVVSLIDNLLYPVLVGKEMRLHTLPVFIAIVGGLITFGAAGIVLGPVILAATITILDILRRRTAYGGSATERLKSPPSRPARHERTAR